MLIPALDRFGLAFITAGSLQPDLAESQGPEEVHKIPVLLRIPAGSIDLTIKSTALEAAALIDFILRIFTSRTSLKIQTQLRSEPCGFENAVCKIGFDLLDFY